MKLLIAGSRTVNDEADYIFLSYALEQFIKSREVEVSEIISGTALGVDTLGERYAQDNDLPVKRFVANWKRHGKAAGPIRNEEMAQYCDVAIIFWDGNSSGTKSMITMLDKYNKPYWLYVKKWKLEGEFNADKL